MRESFIVLPKKTDVTRFTMFYLLRSCLTTLSVEIYYLSRAQHRCLLSLPPRVRLYHPKQKQKNGTWYVRSMTINTVGKIAPDGSYILLSYPVRIECDGLCLPRSLWSQSWHLGTLGDMPCAGCRWVWKERFNVKTIGKSNRNCHRDNMTRIVCYVARCPLVSESMEL